VAPGTTTRDGPYSETYGPGSAKAPTG
jgi:hypothetical protein